jgi:hypothetical protein
MAQVHQSNLPVAVARRLEEIARTCLWLVFALQETKITVRRLRRVLFGKAFVAARPAAQDAFAPSSVGGDETHAGAVVDAGTDETAATRGDPSPRTSPRSLPDKPKGGHRTGTGRHGANAYVGAERVECRHEELAPGQRCPVCGQGTLYELPPGVEIRIDGHALLSAIRYELHKLRCSACGQLFTAPLPSEASPEKYSPRARAVLVVGRYYLGLPLYRIEGYQAMLGVPMPDATQWDQIERVGDCCYVVFKCLETLAAQGELIHQDDTLVRILTLIQENQQIRAQAAAQGLSRAKARTGMFATALVVRVGARLICLYYSGRAHAGENLATLLEQRESDLEPLLAMSDALSRNEVEEGLVIRCHCLAHGRRQFSDLEAVFPSECRVVPCGIESHPVVRDLEPYGFVGECDPHHYVRCLRVLQGVGERFLHDPERGQLGPFGEPPRRTADVDGDRYIRRFLGSSREAADGRHNPEIAQDARAEVERDLVQPGGALLDQVTGCLETGPQLGIVAMFLRHGVQVEHGGREAVSGLIVEIPCYAAALLFDEGDLPRPKRSRPSRLSQGDHIRGCRRWDGGCARGDESVCHWSDQSSRVDCQERIGDARLPKQGCRPCTVGRIILAS